MKGFGAEPSFGPWAKVQSGQLGDFIKGTRTGMVDKQLFRQVCSMFATGVTVVTTGRDGNYHGMTANAFAVGVSLEPTLVLVCLDRNSRTCALLDDTGAFTVNILSEGQQEASRVFASRDLDARRFEGLDFSPGPNGTPVLDGCIATMQCSLFS